MAVKKRQPKPTALIIVLVVAVIALLNWFFFLKPGLEKVGQGREAKAALEQEIDGLNNKLAQKAAVEKRYREMSEGEDYLLAKVPAAGDLPRVLGALEELVKKAGLEVQLFNAGDFREEEGYYFVPVSLHLGGAEEDLLLLLQDLEQFTHLALTEEVAIDRTESNHLLSVDFNLIFTAEGKAEAVGTEEEEAETEEEKGAGAEDLEEDLDQG